MYIHSGEEDDDYDCPLCMEELDIADKNFKPCPCGYKICRFCWHHIRENLNGLCPACRREYSENIVEFEPISADEITRIKREKKEKERQQKEMEQANRRHLANMRVVQKNLVYIIGLHPKLATEETIRSPDYFGHFGKIAKIVINKRQIAPTSHANGTTTMQASAAVYVTYVRKEDATKAIHAVDGSVVAGRILKASYGTTKYCTYYLRNMTCPNPICLYLHEPGEDADTISKEEFLTGKHRDQMSSSGSAHHSDPDKRLQNGNLVPIAHSFQYHHDQQQQSPSNSTSRINSFSSTEFSAFTQQHPAASTSSMTQHSSGSNSNSGSALPATAFWGSGSPLMVKKSQTDGNVIGTTYVTSDTFGPPLSVAVATQQQQPSAGQQKSSKRKAEKKKRKDQKLSQQDKEQFEKELKQTKRLTATLLKKQQQYLPNYSTTPYSLFQSSTTGIARFVLGDAFKQFYSTPSPALTADNFEDEDDDDVELGVDVDELFDYYSRDSHYYDFDPSNENNDNNGPPVGVRALYDESDHPLTPTEEIKKEPRMLDQTGKKDTQKQLSPLDYLSQFYPAPTMHSASLNPFSVQWRPSPSSQHRDLASAFAQPMSPFNTPGLGFATIGISSDYFSGTKQSPSIFNMTALDSSPTSTLTSPCSYADRTAIHEIPLSPKPPVCERKTSRFGFAQF